MEMAVPEMWITTNNMSLFFTRPCVAPNAPQHSVAVVGVDGVQEELDDAGAFDVGKQLGG